MKEIVLQIDDAAYEKFMGMVSLCPQVQVVSEGIEVRGTVDLCVAGAIRELQESGKIKHPSDYAYIMLASNESTLKGLPSFCSPQEFIDYLKELELDRLPGRNTLYDAMNKTLGRYPDWEFSDAPKPAESLRRKNVARLFLSGFSKLKRSVSDCFSDKS